MNSNSYTLGESVEVLHPVQGWTPARITGCNRNGMYRVTFAAEVAYPRALTVAPEAMRPQPRAPRSPQRVSAQQMRLWE